MSDGYVLFCGSSAVAIDYWTAPHASAFFLTHMHADHYKGLHNEWRQGTIYCSETTGLLLQRKWPLLSARTLPLDEPVSVQLSEDEILSVTMIEANHCPGAVMLLFEGSCGRVLHTGDFRWEHGVQAELLKHPALTAGQINLLVLDNTYCHPRYAFPSRLQACQSIISLIKTHTDMHIVLGIDSLGKEDMLAAIAHATGDAVGVAAQRLETVRTAGLPMELFTADMASTRIRALPKWMVTVEMLAKLNRSKPTLGIIPTGFACLSTDSRPAAKLCSSRSAPPVLASSHSARRQQAASDAHPARLHAPPQQPCSMECDVQGQSGQQQPDTLENPLGMGLTVTNMPRPVGGQLQQQLLDPKQHDSMLSQQDAPQIPMQMSQLFSQTEMLKNDLEAYAALVHQQPAEPRIQPVSAAEVEAALPLLKKIPYSLHSSFSELESFVAHLRPQAIVPIVKKCYDSRYPIDPNLHFKHLLGSPGTGHAQQTGQACGRGKKRRGQGGKLAREIDEDEQEDRCPRHGSWQGVLHSCTNAVKQRRMPAEATSQKACSIGAGPLPAADTACGTPREEFEPAEAQTVPPAQAIADQAVKSEDISQHQLPPHVSHDEGHGSAELVSAASLAERGQSSQHVQGPCGHPCGLPGPTRTAQRCIPKWGRTMPGQNPARASNTYSTKDEAEGDTHSSHVKAEGNSSQEQGRCGECMQQDNCVGEGRQIQNGSCTAAGAGRHQECHRAACTQDACGLESHAVHKGGTELPGKEVTSEASGVAAAAVMPKCPGDTSCGQGLMSVVAQICKQQNPFMLHN